MADKDGHDVQLSKNKVKDIGRRYSDRISDDAAIQVAYEIEKKAEEIWSTANELCEHAGRSTVMEEDVRLAVRIMED